MASLGITGSGSGSGLDLSQLTENDKKELQQFIANESQKATIQESEKAMDAICVPLLIVSCSSRTYLERHVLEKGTRLAKLWLRSALLMHYSA